MRYVMHCCCVVKGIRGMIPPCDAIVGIEYRQKKEFPSYHADVKKEKNANKKTAGMSPYVTLCYVTLNYFLFLSPRCDDQVQRRK